jgi:PAS domain S-box-containing protein
MDNTNIIHSDYEKLKQEYSELKAKYQDEVAKNVQTSLIQNRGEYLQSILNTTHDGFWVVNNNGIITDVNDSYCRMSGYSRSEIIGMKISDLDVDETPEETKARIERIVTNGSETFNARHRRKDGSILSVEISVSYQKENGDKICFCRDITDRKKAEQALKESQEKYRRLFENTTSQIIEVDAETFEITSCNPAMARNFGTSPENLIGKDIRKLLPPEVMAKRIAFGEKAFEENKVQIFEDERNGMHLRNNFIPVISNGRKHIQTVSFDITEQKRTEQALKESEEKVRNILENSTNLFYSHTPDHILTYLSPQVEKFLGYTQEEAKVKWTQLVSDNPVNEIGFQNTVKAIETGKPQPAYYLEFVKKSGEKVWGEIRESPIVENGKTTAIVGSLTDITERKKAEQALKESEENIRYILKYNPNAIAVFDNNMNYIHVSDRYLKDYDVKDYDIIGKNHYDIFPEMPDRWRDVHKKALQGEVLRNDNDYFIRPDGSVTYTRWECRPWYHSNGEIGGMIAYTEVITERKLAEKALKESEEKYHVLFEGASDAIFLADIETGRIIEANKKAETLLGRKHHEIIGMHQSELHPPDQLDEAKSSFIRHIEFNDFDFIKELNILHISGKMIPVEISPNIIEINNKKYVYGIFRDITDRKKAEHALKESEERFRTLFEQSAVGIAKVAPDGAFKQVNRRLCEITGYSEQELLELTFTKITHPDDLYLDHKYIEKVLNNEIDQFYIEKRYIHKNKNLIWIKLYSNVVRDNNGNVKYAIATIVDITEQKKAEKALKESEKDLKELLSFNNVIFEESPIGLGIYNNSGQCIRTNKRTENIIGASREEILNQNFHHIESWKKSGLYDKAISALKHNRTEYLTVHVTTTFNNNIWINCKFKPFKSGGDIYLMLMYDDITEQKTAEHALKESEEKFRNIINKSTDVVWTQDLSFNTTYMSQSVEKILGYKVEEYLSMPVNERLPEESIPIAVKELKENVQKIKNGEADVETHTFKFEMLHRHKNGELLWGEVNCSFLYDDEKNITGIHGITRDITDRKRADSELRESRQRLELALQGGELGIWDWNIKTGDVVYSDLWAKILEYNPDEVNPTVDFFMQHIHPKDRTAVIEKLKDLKEGRVSNYQSVHQLSTKFGKWLWIQDSGKITEYDEDENPVRATGVISDITDRKKSEQALKESEERFNLALEAVNDGIWDWNIKENKVLFDKRYYTLAGYEPYEFPQEFDEWKKRVHPDDLENAMNVINEHLEGNTEVFQCRFRFLKKDNFWMWIQARGKLVEYDANGKPLRMIGTHTDIDLILEYEEKLGMYEKIVSIVDDPLSFLDTEYRYQNVNESYARYIDLQINEIIGKTPGEILDDSIFEIQIKPELDKCLSGETISYSHWVLFPKIGKRYMSMNYFPLFSKEGKILGVISHGHDLTEEKKLQDKLSIAERDWRDSFNSLKDIMTIINKDFVIENINESGLDFLGLPLKDVIGRKCHEVFHNTDQPLETCPYKKSMTSKSPESTIWYHQQSGKHFSIHSSPILDYNREIVKFVDLLVDVTKIKIIEQELRKVNETKDKFFSIISHDLRSPLIGIKNLSEEFVKNYKMIPISEMYDIIQAISKASANIFKLLDNLLQWSRVNQGNIENVPMNLRLYDFAAETIDLYKGSMDNKDIECKNNVPLDIIVYVDNSMIQLIFRNLLSNAIKYSNTGSEIRIDANVISDKFIQISISDKGIGMSEDKINQLFHLDKIESYPGTDGEKGTGLGLILCKEFVEMHGGKICCESEVGKGSTFYFSLPKAEDQA